MTEDDLEFIQIRSGTSQWSVRVEGREVAVVTERVIAEPAYSVRIGSVERYMETRDDVTAEILRAAEEMMR